MIIIIKGFWTIVFIFIVISTMFQPIYPPAFFRCLLSKFLTRSLMIIIIKGFWTIVFIFIVISTMFQLNSGTFTELWTTSFIKDVVQSSMKVLEFDKHLRKAGGHIAQNIVEITIKMKTIVQKPLTLVILLWSTNSYPSIANQFRLRSEFSLHWVLHLQLCAEAMFRLLALPIV